MCFTGVDSMVEGYPKLIAIGEEAQHQGVHRRFRKAYGGPYEPLNPGPQVDVFATRSCWVSLSFILLARVADQHLWNTFPF
jgi:hypothetical protein